LSWNTITGYQGERRSILVVDDDPVNRAVLRDLLAPLGFEVALAESGEAALRVALEQRPALILMDLAMPGMDGCEATRRLRQIPELGGVVIVASSAGLSRERREASAQAGCDDFLAKPIEAGALMEQLGRQLCLSWIREANDAPGALAQRGEMAFCLPPAKALAGLLDLANKGRLQDFVEQVNQLEQEDARLGPFCQQVRALAEGFQLNRLREQLQSDVDAVAMAAPR
jgi:CheY-like chemotaxis protein